MATVRRLSGAFAVILAASAPAAAQGPDTSAPGDFRGTFLTDCADSGAARVSVSNDSLVVIGKDCRLAGGDLQPAWAYFGNAPPDGYVVALLATSPAGMEMLGLVFEDSTGLYMTIDVSPETTEATGCQVSGQRYHRCGSGPPPARTPIPSARTYDLHELSASGILLDPMARGLWYDALGPLVEEPWLADLDGPSAENSLVKVDGAEYVLASACKNHDCFENNVVILYSAARRALYGKVYRSGRPTWLGAPPPALARELDRRWREHFRQD